MKTIEWSSLNLGLIVLLFVCYRYSTMHIAQVHLTDVAHINYGLSGMKTCATLDIAITLYEIISVEIS